MAEYITQSDDDSEGSERSQGISTSSDDDIAPSKPPAPRVPGQKNAPHKDAARPAMRGTMVVPRRGAAAAYQAQPKPPKPLLRADQGTSKHLVNAFVPANGHLHIAYVWHRRIGCAQATALGRSRGKGRPLQRVCARLGAFLAQS